MAPIKFEDNIREKLQERELTPSKEAWAKLSEKLDKQNPQKKYNPFIWFALAASFVGILLVTTLFFNKEKQNTQLVKEDTTEVIKDNTKVDGVLTSENIEEKKIDLKENENSEEIEENGTQITQRIESSKSLEKIKPEKIITNQDPKSDALALESTNEEKEMNVEEQFINQKVDEVVVAVQEIQKNNKEITSDEIDALLAKAQRDIANNRILKANTQKVDAAALLMDVETELERSFRDRVFDALGEGFNKVRSAVAERNN